jgi:hypothetical protein
MLEVKKSTEIDVDAPSCTLAAEINNLNNAAFNAKRCICM